MRSIFRALLGVLETGHDGELSQEGILVEQLCAVCCMTDAILTSSARAALYWILRALKPPRLYLPAYLCSSVYECALRADVPMTYLDLVPGSFDTKFEGIDYEPASVLLLVHQYGIPSDPERARDVANKHELVLVEDNAAALGAKWQGVPTGSFGDASIISFEYSKTISACKGGAGLFREECLLAKVKECIDKESKDGSFRMRLCWLRDALEGVLYDIALRPRLYGALILPLFRILRGPFVDHSRTISLGGPYPSGFGAQRATLASLMAGQLFEIVSERRKVADVYSRLLSDIEDVELVPPPSGSEPAYTHYPILVPRGSRERIVRELWAGGVDPGFNFSYLCGGQEAAAAAPVAENYTHRILTLPVSSRIGLDEAEEIASVFRAAIEAAGLK